MMCPSGLFDGVREVSLHELLIELKEVEDWFELGVYLGVPDYKLREIEQDCRYMDVEECKMEMILLWRQMTIPTWSAIVNALTEIGKHKRALEIASKYSKYISWLKLCASGCNSLHVLIYNLFIDSPIPASLKHIVQQLEVNKVRKQLIR